MDAAGHTTERGLDTWRYLQRSHLHHHSLAARSGAGKRTFAEEMQHAHYRGDPHILRLEIDINARIAAYRQSYLCSKACLIPCFSIPINLVCCPTLYLYTCFVGKEKQLAAAHRLTLRQKSLLFEVDEHYAYSHMSRLRNKATLVPSACDAGGLLGDYFGVRIPAHCITIRLADVDSVVVESGANHAGKCTDARGPDQLVVRSRGCVVAAIAAPKNAGTFISAVMEQKHKVLSSNLDADAPPPTSLPRGPLSFDALPIARGGLSDVIGSIFAAHAGQRMQGHSQAFALGHKSGAAKQYAAAYGNAAAPEQQEMTRVWEEKKAASIVSPAAQFVTIVDATIAPPPDTERGARLSDELMTLSEVHSCGILTKEEFEAAKTKGVADVVT